MPKYKKKMDVIIKKADIDEMLRWPGIEKQHKFLVAILYLTGARPSEIMLLERQSFEIYMDRVDVLLKTKKGGYDRTLQLLIESPFVEEIIIPYLMWMDQVGQEKPFTFSSTSMVKHVIYILSGNKYCPYNFRHSRLTKMAKAGASPFELQQWKGAKSMDSVIPYIMHSPPPRDKARLYLE